MRVGGSPVDFRRGLENGDGRSAGARAGYGAAERAVVEGADRAGRVSAGGREQRAVSAVRILPERFYVLFAEMR